jgi:hypothetical protein
MYLEKTSFDAVITDDKGLTIEVDCRVTEPTASGLPAEISIEIPMSNVEMPNLTNPCSLRGSVGDAEIEIKELWYRSIYPSIARRKHVRGTFDINFAGQLSVSRHPHIVEPGVFRFLLSPLRFLKEHSNAKVVDYSSTPRMTVELFKLQPTDLGEIRFIKFWSIHRVDTQGIAAEIRVSFAAEVSYNGTSPIEPLVSAMKLVLTPLSILTRHGWIWDSGDSRNRIKSMWFNPLDPNLAPDMAQQPVTNVCVSNEFEPYAQAIVENFLKASPKKRDAVTQLSVALAPHVERSTAANFSALFGALEEVVNLEKLTKDEKKKLRETDDQLRAALLDKKRQIEAEANGHSSAVAARLDGFANKLQNSGPSFSIRFDNFKAKYPRLDDLMADLWPLLGTDKEPGLKQIRDSLAHGLSHKYSGRAIAVAHWHFACLAERLAFLVLNVDVPDGISPGSCLLRREQWYSLAEWRAVQASAKHSS